jgi:hypothetical protein
MALYIQKAAIVMLSMKLQQCLTDLAENLPRASTIIDEGGLATIAAVNPA